MITVYGTYLTPDGRPAQGAVRFTLRPAARTDPYGEQITEGPVVCTLDENGSFTQQLIPDSDLLVSGIAVYVVHERVTGLTRTWNLYVDGLSGSVDVPSRYPGPNYEAGVVVPVEGIEGPPGEMGPPGPEGDPTGVYIQPDQPDGVTPPPFSPLWVDTDETLPAVPGLVQYAGAVGGGSDVAVFHGLGSQSVSVDVVRMTSPWDSVECGVTRPTSNTVMLHFAVPVAAGQFGCIVRATEITPARTPVDVRTFGAVGDGTTDDQGAVQAALDSLVYGDTLLFPSGLTFAHSGTLNVSVAGVTLNGGGTLLATNENLSSLMVRDVNNVRVEHLTVDNAASTYRHAEWEQTGLLLLDTVGCAVNDVTIARSGSAGLQIEGSSFFTVTGVIARDTWSDGIHLTGGSHDGYLNNLLVERSGDDGLACVSYETSPPNADILAENVVVRDQLSGRSFSVVGGTRITYRHIRSERSAGAAVMVACESSYLTHGVDTVLMEGVDLVESNAVGPDQGAILIYSGRDGYAISDVTLRDVTVLNTNMSASRQIGIIAEGYPTVTTTVVERVSLETVDVTGGGSTLYINAPSTSFRYSGVTVNGTGVPDYVGWS